MILTIVKFITVIVKFIISYCINNLSPWKKYPKRQNLGKNRKFYEKRWNARPIFGQFASGKRTRHHREGADMLANLELQGISCYILLV